MNTARTAERPASRDQVRKIFALCAELGFDADLRHDMQFALTGKTSLKDFTSANANVVIDHLLRTSNTPTSGAMPHRTTRTGSSPVAGLTPLNRDGALPKPTPVPTSTNRAEPSLPGADLIPSLNRDAAGTGVTTRPAAIPLTAITCQPSAVRKSVGRKQWAVGYFHKLPSPSQLKVLEHLYNFAGYKTEESRRTFAARIEKHARPRSMWEAEELVFALMPQAAPNMYNHMMHGLAGVLTPFERGFLFSNRRDERDPHSFNAAKKELEDYMAKHNKRGSRTVPRFSLTKFFEIVEKYK